MEREEQEIRNKITKKQNEQSVKAFKAFKALFMEEFLLQYTSVIFKHPLNVGNNPEVEFNVSLFIFNSHINVMGVKYLYLSEVYAVNNECRPCKKLNTLSI